MHQLRFGTRVLAWLATATYILIMLYIFLLALPIVGTFAYAFLVDHLQEGCKTTAEGFGIDCYRNGVDVGELTAQYVVGIFLAGIWNPWLAYKTVKAVMPLWVLFVWPLVAVGLHFVAARLSAQLRGRAEVIADGINSPP